MKKHLILLALPLIAISLVLAKGSYALSLYHGQCLQWEGPTFPEKTHINIYVEEIGSDGFFAKVCYSDKNMFRHCDEDVFIDEDYVDFLDQCTLWH